jgi:hypothetical protein
MNNDLEPRIAKHLCFHAGKQFGSFMIAVFLEAKFYWAARFVSFALGRRPLKVFLSPLQMPLGQLSA